MSAYHSHIPDEAVLNSKALEGFSAKAVAVLRILGKIQRIDKVFPLRSSFEFESIIDPIFPSREFHISLRELKTSEKLKATMGFLTIAGMDSPLPYGFAEELLWDVSGAGRRIHRFLDLINTRFWELQFSTEIVDRIDLAHLMGNDEVSMKELFFCIAGLWMKDRAAVSEVNLSASLVKHRFSSGDSGGLLQVLRNALEIPNGALVELERYVPANLPLDSNVRWKLGATSTAQGGVLGTYAMVRVGNNFRITGITHKIQHEGRSELLFHWIRRLILTIRLINGISYCPTSFCLGVRSNSESSMLGSSIFRIGWGCCIASEGEASQILNLTFNAVERMECTG